MHHNSNKDHSMVTAMAAVENTANDVETRHHKRAVHAELEYHEAKTGGGPRGRHLH
jgi:hypothetical protein